MKKNMLASALLVMSAAFVACAQPEGYRPRPTNELTRDDLRTYPEAIQTHLEKLMTEVNRVEKLDDIDFHKSAYQFAVGRDGLYLSQADAQKFADELEPLRPRDRALRFVVYQTAYRYALSRDGLYLSMNDSRDFAKNAVAVKRPLDFVARHRAIYQHAAGRDGLYLSMEDSRELANRIAVDPKIYPTLEVHQKWYKYAISRDGLYLSMTDARAYADKKAGWVAPKK